MKNFITMSRKEAIRYTYKLHSEDYIIISINDITDTDTKPPKFNRSGRLKDVLYLYFDDISKPLEGYISISEQDAIKIIEFINKYEEINNIIIHCTAGVSRSVSIRCALEEIYNNRQIGKFPKDIKYNKYKELGLNDMLKEKDDTIYILNKLCYDKVKFIYKYLKFRSQYKDNPDLFIEEFLGIKLSPYQKILLKKNIY